MREPTRNRLNSRSHDFELIIDKFCIQIKNDHVRLLKFGSILSVTCRKFNK